MAFTLAWNCPATATAEWWEYIRNMARLSESHPAIWPFVTQMQYTTLRATANLDNLKIQRTPFVT